MNGSVVSGGHVSFQNNLPEWFIRYFGHGDDQTNKQPGEPSASMLVEQ